MLFTDIKRYWEVRYKSPSTGQIIIQIFNDEEEVDNFIYNIGINCEVQEMFN